MSVRPGLVCPIAKALDDAGVDAIEVAHGDGLSGTSFNYGFGAHTDWEWLEAVAEVLTKSVLTTLILPGLGTVEELRRASDLGVRSVRVATHCTEADVSKQHIRSEEHTSELKSLMRISYAVFCLKNTHTQKSRVNIT